MLRWALSAIALALAAGGVSITIAYSRAMDRAYQRIGGGSEVIGSPLGDIEYADRGVGPAVLVVHGSGGGFDQGLLLAQAALGDGLRRIVPSRFGYLRSTVHAGATFDDQAQAYAHLLDRLGLQRVAVVAFSHGGPSAALFAALYPQRVSSLTLLSAGVASSDSPGQLEANRRGDALARIFQHDLGYWAVATALRGRLLSLMGADAQVIAQLTLPQRQLIDELIEVMHPVAPRAAGVRFDNRAPLPNERIAAIRAPTLIVHARDDSLQRFHHAEFAARTIPGARLHAFEHGGHLLVAVQQDAVQRLVRQHVLTQVDPALPLAPQDHLPRR
ncbi:MAG: alpha/beta hydrolase [Ideonella sp.]|nr:alpha/beta hydrolase [Ideonella sp.]MCC7458148.1 alpha/beta hydrolase [Nitrospira sp.]